jgi:RNA polymerase sigma-54 factor
VNDRGYLGLSVEEIALSANSSLEEVEEAIAIVQKCDPPGVAAKSVAECIALQLKVDDHPQAAAAYKAVTEHFDWIVQKNTRSLSRALRCTPDVVEEIYSLIASLEPYPGEQFSPSSNVTSLARTEARALPEIIFDRTDNGWDVQIMGSDQSDLRINSTYTSAIQDAKKAKSKQSTVHLVEFVKRADRLLTALEQRKETLRRIATFLLEHQKGFILPGQFRFLEDLTRAKLAEEVGLHESTISRATNGKCIQLATGEVVSFDLFFNHSLKIRDLIGEILGFENPNKPLSDAEIAKRLNDQGIQIARRTIAKYRDRDKHLSSRVRRTA